MPETTETTILAAAKKVFIKKGYAGARMQAIADEAGINKAMLHYYYRSKEKLFRVVFEQAMMGLIPKLDEALSGNGSVVEKLEKVVRAYVAHIQENEHLPLFVLHEIAQNRIEFIASMKSKAARFPNFPQFFMQIIQEQEAGKIRAILPVHLLLNILGMVVFPFIAKPVFCNVIEIPEADFDSLMKDRADVIVDFMKNALTP
ncbi:MAG TPA: TetR/AcrR family transcriptional regulator [Bacteroidetes bacterium]|nr:TetR/AcrR family transcriptional regulator [Bacteroidota bacterium]